VDIDSIDSGLFVYTYNWKHRAVGAVGASFQQRWGGRLSRRVHQFRPAQTWTYSLSEADDLCGGRSAPTMDQIEVHAAVQLAAAPGMQLIRLEE
jgi:hypothetical protein